MAAIFELVQLNDHTPRMDVVLSTKRIRKGTDFVVVVHPNYDPCPSLRLMCNSVQVPLVSCKEAKTSAACSWLSCSSMSKNLRFCRKWHPGRFQYIANTFYIILYHFITCHGSSLISNYVFTCGGTKDLLEQLIVIVGLPTSTACQPSADMATGCFSLQRKTT